VNTSDRAGIRSALWAVVVLAVSACGSGSIAEEAGSLDLGGGITMSADGQIFGATPLAEPAPPPAAATAAPAWM
jgi:hypothetical protein